MPKFSEIPYFLFEQFLGAVDDQSFLVDYPPAKDLSKPSNMLVGPRTALFTKKFKYFVAYVKKESGYKKVKFVIRENQWSDHQKLYFFVKCIEGESNIDSGDEVYLRKDGAFYDFVSSSKSVKEGLSDYINVARQFHYIGQIFDDTNGWRIEHVGMKDFAAKAIPENNQEPAFIEFLNHYFDVVYQPIYYGMGNINSLIDSDEVPGGYLHYLAQLYSLNLSNYSMPSEKLRTLVKFYPHILKKKGTYYGEQIIWNLLVQFTKNKLTIYDRWHQKVLPNNEIVPYPYFKDYPFESFYELDPYLYIGSNLRRIYSDGNDWQMCIPDDSNIKSRIIYTIFQSFYPGLEYKFPNTWNYDARKLKISAKYLNTTTFMLEEGTHLIDVSTSTAEELIIINRASTPLEFQIELRESTGEIFVCKEPSRYWLIVTNEEFSGMPLIALYDNDGMLLKPDDVIRIDKKMYKVFFAKEVSGVALFMKASGNWNFHVTKDEVLAIADPNPTSVNSIIQFSSGKDIVNTKMIYPKNYNVLEFCSNNLLVNGAFNHGFYGWSFYGLDVSTGASFVYDAELERTCLEITRTHETDPLAGALQYINGLIPGATYKISFRIKNIDCINWAYVLVSTTGAGGTNLVFYTVAGASEWIEDSVEFVATETYAYVCLQISTQIKGTKARFDNISIFEVQKGMSPGKAGVFSCSTDVLGQFSATPVDFQTTLPFGDLANPIQHNLRCKFNIAQIFDSKGDLINEYELESVDENSIQIYLDNFVGPSEICTVFLLGGGNIGEVSSEYPLYHGGAEVMSPHFKVEFDINNESVGSKDVFPEFIARSLYSEWENFRPAMKVGHYHILFSPKVSFDVETKKHYEVSGPNWTHHTLQLQKIAPGVKVVSVKDCIDDAMEINHGFNTKNLVVDLIDKDNTGIFSISNPNYVKIETKNKLEVGLGDLKRGYLAMLPSDNSSTFYKTADDTSSVSLFGIPNNNITDLYTNYDWKIEAFEAELLDFMSGSFTFNSDEPFVKNMLKLTTVPFDYEHTQDTPSDQWIINHNSGYLTHMVRVYDWSGHRIYPERIDFESDKSTVITFATDQVGKVFLKYVGDPDTSEDGFFGEAQNGNVYMKLSDTNRGINSAKTIKDIINPKLILKPKKIISERDKMILRFEVPYEEQFAIREFGVFDSTGMRFYSCGGLIYKLRNMFITIDFTISRRT